MQLTSMIESQGLQVSTSVHRCVVRATLDRQDIGVIYMCIYAHEINFSFSRPALLYPELVVSIKK